MEQRDCKDQDHEEKRVADFDRWRTTRGRDGMTNEQKQNRWCEINRKFKEHKVEGLKIHTTDELRKQKRISYE